MNEEEIKKLRFSFSNQKDDMAMPVTNQFGHTILGSTNEKKDLDDFDLSIDETGEAKAQLKQSVLDSPEFIKWLEKQQNSEVIEEPKEEIQVEQEDSRNLFISGLISQLDDLSPKTQKVKPVEENVIVQHSKSCFNKSCLYALPKDAKFCLKCGTAQLAQFCTECGYNFKDLEKFCPDCGNKR
jgi:RNA polymerase subunit RPABC4/transcription elongation factor Spt4